MYQSGGGLALGSVLLGISIFLYALYSVDQVKNSDKAIIRNLEHEIQELTIKIDKYERDIASLSAKTDGGKNPQLLKQIKGKPEKLAKLKSLLNEKQTALVGAKGS
ncbi:hypothetical protein [Halioxenophilus aromaticivorans]|uniref:Uncharacterized protein n=1 Tax=Halioxenophilus aromaticivorans TaxID=1306992 RepID=A0AAV3U6U9_9ALTE